LSEPTRLLKVGELDETAENKAAESAPQPSKPTLGALATQVFLVAPVAVFIAAVAASYETKVEILSFDFVVILMAREQDRFQPIPSESACFRGAGLQVTNGVSDRVTSYETGFFRNDYGIDVWAGRDACDDGTASQDFVRHFPLADV